MHVEYHWFHEALAGVYSGIVSFDSSICSWQLLLTGIDRVFLALAVYVSQGIT